MEEAAQQLAEKLDEVPETDSKARLMMPPTPILRDENWPLLTISKGFFENLAAKTVGGQFTAPYFIPSHARLLEDSQTRQLLLLPSTY